MRCEPAEALGWRVFETTIQKRFPFGEDTGRHRALPEKSHRNVSSEICHAPLLEILSMCFMGYF